MNGKKYFYLLTMFFTLSIHSMDIVDDIDELVDAIIDVTPNASIQITPSEEIAVPRGPLIGNFQRSRGGKKEVPQNFQDMRSLVRERSVVSIRSTPQKKVTSVPPIDIQKVQRRRLVPTSVQEKEEPPMYTLEQVQALLNQQAATQQPLVSERLLELGRQNNVPLDRLHQHAYLFDEIEVTPRMLAEAIYNLIGEQDKKPKEFEINRYEKILRERPAKYEELVFDIFEELMGDEPGSTHKRVVPTRIVDTHAGIYRQELEAQETNLFHAKVLIVVKFLAICGTTAWAIYGQVSGTCPSLVNSTAV